MIESFFDPNLGWVAPSDYHESETHRSLKEIVAALKEGESDNKLSDGLFDATESLLHKYQIFIKQGVRATMAKHTGVSWYLTDGPDDRALISYQDGFRTEWSNDCFVDEVPLWLLIGLFRRIQRRKPLGDQDADNAIARVDDLDAAYVRTKNRQELEKNLSGLSIYQKE